MGKAGAGRWWQSRKGMRLRPSPTSNPEDGEGRAEETQEWGQEREREDTGEFELPESPSGVSAWPSSTTIFLSPSCPALSHATPSQTASKCLSLNQVINTNNTKSGHRMSWVATAAMFQPKQSPSFPLFQDGGGGGRWCVVVVVVGKKKEAPPPSTPCKVTAGVQKEAVRGGFDL